MTVDQYNTIAIVIALVLGLIVMGGLIWSYTVEATIFIAVLSGLFMLYSLQNIVLIYGIRTTLKPWVYKVYLGTSIFFTLLSAASMITFIVLSIRRMSQRTSPEAMPMPMAMPMSMPMPQEEPSSSSMPKPKSTTPMSMPRNTESFVTSEPEKTTGEMIEEIKTPTEPPTEFQKYPRGGRRRRISRTYRKEA